MVTRAAALLMIILATPACAGELDLGVWSRSLPSHFSVSGSKNEPTYLAAIDIRRDGDRIAVLGGAPAWMERSLEAVEVATDGTIRQKTCPQGMDCTSAPHPAGFLSTASLLSASRKGKLVGMAKVERFGTWDVVCIDAERLDIPRPILDPCFEIRSGAAIAQRHRLSQRFDGPSLDPVSVRIDIPGTHLPTPTSSKDKAS